MRALLALVLLLTPALGCAQEIGRATRAVVLDAEGRRVGPVLDLAPGGGATVLLRVLGQPLALTVLRADFEPNQVGPLRGSNSSLNYTSTDCTGTPYALGHPRALQPPVVVHHPGLTVYLPTGPVGPLTVWRSLRAETGECLIRTDNPEGYLVPLAPALDLLDHFTPPFRVRVR